MRSRGLNELVDIKYFEEYLALMMASTSARFRGLWRGYKTVSQNVLSKKSNPTTSRSVLDSDLDKAKANQWFFDINRLISMY